MQKKSKVMIALLSIGMLIGSVCVISHATDLSNYTLQGKGRFEYDADGSGTAGDSTEDVVYDASDLATIENRVKTGKESLSTALNQYPNTEVATLDTFANLSTAIDTITSVPDVYYYDKATEGDTCQRYMLIDGAYYPCDQNGIKTSNTALTGTITVIEKGDASIPTAGETQLVKYAEISSASISAGYAGFVNKSFILGSGADNMHYKEIGASELPTGVTPTFSMQHATPWNATNTLQYTVPAGNYFKVDYSNTRIYMGNDSSDYTASSSQTHARNTTYYADVNTKVSYSVTTKSGMARMSLLVVYWGDEEARDEYTRGYEDAKNAARIENIYHAHDNSCYSQVADSIVSWSGSRIYSNERTCDACGKTAGHQRWMNNVRLASGKVYSSVSQCPHCGQYRYHSDTDANVLPGTKFSMGTYSAITCGKNEGDLEGATIVFD